MENYRFSIYDRWGVALWSSAEPRQPWVPDAEIPLGVYVWMLELRPITVNERAARTLYGHVVLLR